MLKRYGDPGQYINNCTLASPSYEIIMTRKTYQHIDNSDKEKEKWCREKWNLYIFCKEHFHKQKYSLLNMSMWILRIMSVIYYLQRKLIHKEYLSYIHARGFSAKNIHTQRNTCLTYFLSKHTCTKQNTHLLCQYEDRE